MANTFVLTEHVEKVFLGRKGELPFCERCKTSFKVGEKVVSTGSTRSTRRHYYHKQCYEEMFI